MAKSKIKDIYNGEIISAWEDGGYYFITIYNTTVSITKEDWVEFKNEIEEMIKKDK